MQQQPRARASAVRRRVCLFKNSRILFYSNNTFIPIVTGRRRVGAV